MEKYITLEGLEKCIEKIKQWGRETFLTANDIEVSGWGLGIERTAPSYLCNRNTTGVRIYCDDFYYDQLNSLGLRINSLEASQIQHINRLNAFETNKEKYSRFKDNRGLRSQLCMYEEWSEDIYEVL